MTCVLTTIWMRSKKASFKRIVMSETTNRANSFNTGIAAEYFVLSQLYRLGLEAYISQGNKKAIDIRVIQKDGTALSVDVKAVRGYSSLIVNNVRPASNHFIVFVVYDNKFEDVSVPPKIFVVPSDDIPKIAKSFKNEKRVMKGDINGYKDKWDLLIG